MNKLRIIPFISMFLIFSCSLFFTDDCYESEVNWNVTIVNKRSQPLTVFAYHQPSDDRKWAIERVDEFDIKPLIIDTLLPASLMLCLKFSNCYGIQPAIEDDHDAFFKITFDSNHVNTDSIQVSLFPFPEYKDYVLCDRYSKVDLSEWYKCSKDYYDTIWLFPDTVKSTIKSFYWRKILH